MHHHRQRGSSETKVILAMVALLAIAAAAVFLRGGNPTGSGSGAAVDSPDGGSDVALVDRGGKSLPGGEAPTAGGSELGSDADPAPVPAVARRRAEPVLNMTSNLTTSLFTTSDTLAIGSGTGNFDGSAPGVASGEESATPEDERASIAGVVLSPDRAPVPGVRLQLEENANEGWGEAKAAFLDLASGADGTFSRGGIPPGRYQLAVIPPSGFPYRLPNGLSLMLRKGETRDKIEIVLQPGDRIEGVVVDAAGEPVAKAAVSATVAFDRQQVETDAQGRFAIEGVPPEGVVEALTVVHADYLPQTRLNVRALDGTQRFILQQSNNINLHVTWALDNTPVTLYAYRMFQPAVTGIDQLAGREELTVNSEDGRAALNHLRSGKWRAEVTVLAPDGNPTDIRAGATFELPAGEKGRDIPIRVTGGATIRGVVVREADRSPLAGARVYFTMPSDGFGRFPDPAAAFTFPEGTSGAQGEFEFVGMPPGKFSLYAEFHTMRATRPIDVVVGYEGNPPPSELVMAEGGVVYGAIIGQDGKPAANAGIATASLAINADGWLNRQSFQTDAEGKYRIEGLIPGVHYVWAYVGQDARDEATVELKAGMEIEKNFDFSGAINIMGVITVNGGDARAFFDQAQLVSGGSHKEWIQINADGSYNARVTTPGPYVMSMIGPRDVRGFTPPFVVTATPQFQTHNLAIEVADAQVVVVYPEDVTFTPGQAILTPRDPGRRYEFIRMRMEQESQSILLIGGEYTASFATRDGVWLGETDWMRVGASGENTFTIDARKVASGVRIGGWAPGELDPINVSTLQFDATSILESTGKIEVIMDYETGRHAVDTRAVSLLENGREISRDEHLGWSGSDKWGITYRLDLGNRQPNSTYTIQTQLKGDGGNDSKGSVYLSLN